jgi:hypothetical protein
MATAAGLASDATALIPAVPFVVVPGDPSRASGDPLDALVSRVRARAGGSVDALQVAALLEADGVTDRTARTGYGFADVFELAEEVYRRGIEGAGVPRSRRVGGPVRDRTRTARELSHGLLYLLPAALLPAAVALIAARPLLVALVLAGGLGWVWASGTAWLAHQCLNLADERMAGRVLAAGGVAGLGAGAAAGTAVALTAGGGVAAALLVPGVLAYQMASTTFVFYGEELWLAGMMAPAVLAGILYLLGGRDLLLSALGAAAVCVSATFVVAVRLARRTGAGRTVSGIGGWRGLLRGRLRTLAAVLAYSALAAAFLLHAQAPYLLGRVDVVFAALPLVVTMGVVEWRARRFTEESRRLLTRLRSPREFGRRVWLLLGADVAICWAATAVAGVAVLAVLDRWGRLTPAAVGMAAAQAALAGAYLVGFVLAAHGRYGRLCAALGAALAAHLAGPALVATLAPAGVAVPDPVLYLFSTLLLQLLLLAGLGPVLGQVRRYR